MNRKNTILRTTLVVGIILSVFFMLLEFISNNGCVCFQAFNPTKISKIIGYTLLIIAFLLFIASFYRVKNLSKWWMIPTLIVFCISFYGNGYKIFSLMGGCGDSINKTTCFIFDTKLGDFATDWGINVDSIKTEKYNGTLLGYSISEQELTLYRIGDEPLKVKTSFLFWKVEPNIFIHRLSPRLHSYRNVEFEKNNNGYELIGGKNMPMEVFLNEIMIEKNDFAGKKLINKRIIDEIDGTTRFRFEIE